MKQLQLYVLCLCICLGMVQISSAKSAESIDSTKIYYAKQVHQKVAIDAKKLTQTSKPQNVILFIGDGMGVSQVFSALTANHGTLNLEYLKYMGFSKTQSANKFITDSGAGGTALATGHKTNNHMVGLTPDSLPVPNLIELAEAKGLLTGFVVTCANVHATPADFYAHSLNRYFYHEIASDFLDVDIDVAIGGGLKYFEADSSHESLIPQLKKSGYTVVTEFDQLATAPDGKLFAALAQDHLPKAVENPDYMEKSVEIALNRLGHHNKGFFLMVEGSQIDWGGHNNDTGYIVEETLALDRAIGVALKFTVRDGNTLIVCTADHETGGMVVKTGCMKTGEVYAEYVTGTHTGVMVPVYAIGPGADRFLGIYENTVVFDRIKELLKL